jgi:hypothetical protein
MNTTVKKPKDQGLSRVKKAMDSKQNPLSMWERDFVRTSCRILDIKKQGNDQPDREKSLGEGLWTGEEGDGVDTRSAGRPGEESGEPQEATPTPAFAMRTYDDMDAPGRSLAHLQTCARGLRNATVGGFFKGIKVAKIVVENAIEDFKVTIARTAEACKWRHGVAEKWYAKGEEVCRNLLEEADQALKEAEGREAAEAKVQLMESECEELASLADQAEKQATLEMEPEPLIELAEGMEHKKGNVVSLGQLLKETILAEFKERVQQAIQDSVKIARRGNGGWGTCRPGSSSVARTSRRVVTGGPWGWGQQQTSGANL